MIMVRRDFEVSGTDSTDYFLKVMPASLPSTGLEVILWEKFQPLKEKFVAAFLEKPFVWEIYASLEVLYEDGNKKSYFYAYGQIKSSVNFDDCILSGFNIPIESRPQNRSKEDTLFLQIMNELKTKGYNAKEKNLSLFMDRKIDELLFDNNETRK